MALWSLCLNVAKFAIDDIDDDLRTSKSFLVSSVRLCWVIMVFWFPFFFKLTSSKCKKTHRISEIFSHSAKAMPWSLWKWLGSQRIFEGIKFPNPIGYSPGQAHVTNIDPKCSFFYWAWKSENRIPIFSLVYLGCPWGCILKSTLVAPALKENIFEKVKQNTRKRTKHHSERTPKSMYDCVGWSWSFGSPSFFQIDLVKMFKKS